MRHALLLFLPLVFLTNCSKFESKSTPVIKPETVTPLGVQTDITQIGDFFNRTPLSADLQENYQKSIFKLESDVSGKKGIAVFLGVFEDRYLFMTAKHVLDVETDVCDFMVSVLSLNGEDFFVCSGDAVSLKDMDITIFTTERFAGEKELVPLKLSVDAPSNIESAVVRTVDRDLNLIVADNSEDCFILDEKPRLILDPEEENSLFAPSWSVPIGCDAQPGDSGAPVMSKVGEVIGILWGGRSVKKFKSSLDLKLETQNEDPKIWKDYNFMVPSHLIISKLSETETNEESAIAEVLSEFLSGYLPKK